MSDWGAAADEQEQQNVHGSASAVGTGRGASGYSQSSGGSHQTRNQPGAGGPVGQLPSYFTDGPLSKPFVSSSASSWDSWGATPTAQSYSDPQGRNVQLGHNAVAVTVPGADTRAPQRAAAADSFATPPTATSTPAQNAKTNSRAPRTSGAPAGSAVDTSSQESGAAQIGEDDEAPTKAELSLLNKLLRQSVVENTQSLEVQQHDPNNPLYSAKTFEELPLRSDVRNGLYAMGFNRPSKIQETALPLLLADPPQNLIAQSQSGTGKTAAFVLAMISRVNESQTHPQALVLAPTLELARQIGDVCTQMLRHCPDIHVAYATRGNQAPKPGTCTEQIIIGTPGTVNDWLRRHSFDPKKIGVFVLDEADVMISQQGHQDGSIRIQRMLRPSTQMMLFSATYDQPVMDFAKKVIPDPVVITLKRQEESLDNIRQLYIEVRNQEEKFEALSHLYGLMSIGQAIVFCQSRKSAAWLAGKMSGEGHATAILTGDLETDQRLAVLQRFRDHAKERLLITTNVCARGIDIEQVSLVVNYDIPYDVVNRRPDFENYLHRIGRTGRFGKTGVALNFVDGHRSLSNMKAIEEHFGRKIEKLDLSDAEQIASLE